MAGAGLAALTLLLWYRLDPVDLQAYIAEQSSRLPDTTLEIQSSRISFMHGLGLRLEGVKLQAPSFSMQAEHIDVGVHLLPLLLGKIEISALAIHLGTFTLAPSAMLDAKAGGLAALPVERIQLIHCHLLTDNGLDILDNIYLDLRDIGNDRETLWELQAKQNEQSLRGHGRLNFRQGEVTAGFGKLKLNHVSVSALQPFAPDMLASWFGHTANHVSGSLTLDITGRHAWSLFGEMALQSSRFEHPLRLRGKLIHPSDERMEWRDSFIHFDDKTAIAINGQCLKSTCKSSIKAKNMPLSTWVKLFPAIPEGNQRLSAKTSIQSDIQWQPSAWQADIRLQLLKPSYRGDQRNITLPDISIEHARATGTKKTWQISGKAAFAHSNDALAFTLRRKKERTTARLQSHRLEGSWPALANILLSTWHLKPELKGDGFISGSIELGRSEADQTLKVNLDAEHADIRHPLFVKPAATRASCQASIRWWGERHDKHIKAKLAQCRLHNSRVEALEWQSDSKTYKLNSKGLSLDFDALQKQALQLPGLLPDFHGQINGSFTSQWDRKSPDLWPWVTHAGGTLNLQRLGTKVWQASGAMHANQGSFTSNHLHIQGIHGHADLKGDYDFFHHAGKLDILSSALDWQQMPDVPKAWKQVQLSGHIQQGHVKLLGNSWQEISGEYRLEHGEITIRKFQAQIGGGLVSSPKLKMIPLPSGLRTLGKLRAKNIKLDKLSGLEAWLGFSAQGRLHANLQLQGMLPATHMGDWKGSNGDILIYDGGWSRQGDASSLVEKMGLSTPAVSAYAFRKLEGRFRVRGEYMNIRSISLLHGTQLYRGSGQISASGETHATFSEDKNRYRLTGIWPKLQWFASRPE